MGPEVVWVSGEKKDEKKKEGKTERKKNPRDAAVAGENKQPDRQLRKERTDRPAGKDQDSAAHPSPLDRRVFE